MANDGSVRAYFKVSDGDKHEEDFLKDFPDGIVVEVSELRVVCEKGRFVNQDQWSKWGVSGERVAYWKKADKKAAPSPASTDGTLAHDGSGFDIK